MASLEVPIQLPAWFFASTGLAMTARLARKSGALHIHTHVEWCIVCCVLRLSILVLGKLHGIDAFGLS